MLKFYGRVDNQAVAEVEKKTGTFKITVKVDGWKSGKTLPEGATLAEDSDGDDIAVWYKNDKELFSFDYVPRLQTALKYYGATLDESQIQFLEEALKGSEETGKAVSALLKVVNDNLEANAQRNAYSAMYQAKKPRTEDTITNSQANMVRMFSLNERVSVETAIDTLKKVNVIAEDFTLEKYQNAKMAGRKAS